VIDIENTRPFPAQEFLQPRSPLDQRQSSQVFAIQKQQVESKEQTLTPAEQQVIEHRAPRLIDTGNLAIDNRILHSQVLADPLRQTLEVAEHVAVP